MATVNETIHIIIRCANNKYADFSIDILSSSTIYNLKQTITLNHPTKPLPKNQRLIHSGKLLDDKNILNQVFIKSNIDSPFLVHLVLDSDKNEISSTIPQQTTTAVNSSSHTEQSSSTSLHSSTYEQYINELNKYQQQLHQFMSNPHGILLTSNSDTQTYLQYCHTHHRMYQNNFVHQQPITSTSIPSPSITVSPTTPITNNNNNNNVNQENDLLRTLHIIIEIFILCSIIYFYSTFNHFFLIFIIFALVYLHCRGYLSIQQRRHAQNQQIPHIVEQAAGNDVEQGMNEEIDTEQIQNDEPNSNDIQLQESSTVTPPTTESATDNQITPTRLLFTAVSTFFSSLIPERPQQHI
ncbi:unnamed protein product [Adineta steineri]|uniref:Ubiquitin-like domain-containing protein n=1 Tax=Adineta steineri TaxID=433720 RepID=A0A814E2H0_9BILA|nr:unnamed protein product [Adineta steineri]CAF3541953.1 unnamed protein product [Adineta steineri]